MRLTPEVLPMLKLRSCQLTLLMSLAFGALLAVFSAPLTAQTTQDLRTTIPNLSGYDDETRRIMELACGAERIHGPVAYGACLNRQIASLQKSPGIPNLSGYDSETRHGDGYIKPARDSLKKLIEKPALQRSPGIPNQSGYDSETRLADGAKLVGNWLVSEKEDHFESGGTFFAVTGDGAGNLFAVRCIENTLTLGIGQIDNATRKYQVGDKYYIKLRVDKQPVLELTGVAVTEALIQVDATAEIVRSIRDGKEIAVRQESIQGVSNTTIFDTKGNAKAFARLTKECKAN